jgi:glycosyltransferase involved in cell wall biosynthesis
VIKIVGDYAWEQGVQRFGVKENLDQFVEKSDYSLPVRILRTVQKWSAEKADLVIVPSQYLKRLIFYWGIPNGKISVIYNAFQAYVSTQTKQDLREELGIFAPTIISVGRFVPWKGFKVLMDAVGQVQKTIPDVVLEIAGSGDSAEYVQYAHEHGYDFVHFLGVLSHDELMRRIRAADCFALNTGYEGLSHVILEAMALETPIVTTNVGGNPELFASWSQVPLAEYNDEAELSSRMLLMLSDKQSSGNAAKSAKVFVESFTEQRMAQETASMLQSLFPTI